MSSSEVVEAYLRGEISRRALIRRLVAVGVSLGAAVAYAELLRPEWAFASHQCSDEYYDLYGFYPPGCDQYGHSDPPPQDPPPPSNPQTGPSQTTPTDTTPPSTRMKVSRLSLATLLLTGRLIVRFTASEASSVTITATMAAPRGSVVAEGARRIVAARGSATFRRPGTKRVAVKLTRAGRRALLKRRRARLKLTARAVDAGGNASVRALTLRLR